MGWEHSTPRQLREQLKDPRRNGGRNLKLLAQHFATDPRVAWGWNPGGGRGANAPARRPHTVPPGAVRRVLRLPARFDPQVRIFGAVTSALASGRAGGPRPTDTDTLDLSQGLVELAAPVAPGRLWVRAGRQEMVFGATRARYLGLQPSVQLDWFASRFLRGQLAYAYFVPGAAIKESGPGFGTSYLLASTTLTC